MKKSLIACAGLAVAIGGVVQPPAHAQQEHTLLLPSPVIDANARARGRGLCAPDFVGSEQNGKTDLVVDIHGAAAAHAASGSWRADAASPGGGVREAGPSLNFTIYDSSCATTQTNGTIWGTGGFTVPVPANGYWIIFTMSNAASAHITI